MKNKKLILIITIILIIIAIILYMAIASIKKQNTVSSEPHIKTEEEWASEELENLKQMSEKERIQTYVAKYLSYLEEGNYEEAYNLLYGEFKDNYFNTIDDFTKYVKQKYPDLITVNYTNLQLLGTYYVVTVEFSDLINNEKNFTQLFVVKENNYNDFVISFQAE